MTIASKVRIGRDVPKDRIFRVTVLKGEVERVTYEIKAASSQKAKKAAFAGEGRIIESGPDDIHKISDIAEIEEN